MNLLIIGLLSFWVLSKNVVKINPRKPSIKNKKGGLSAYGRKYFKKKFGNNLKAGVKKIKNKKDKIRWARWAVRFYNRKKIPKLVKNGKLTRYAIMAHAWGVKPPRTIKEARKIGKRGHTILKASKARKRTRRRKSSV